MQTGTYKLYRVKNHYHVIGERCHHIGRTPRSIVKTAFSRVKTRRPSKSINLAYAVIFGLFLGVLTLLFMSTEVTYAKEVETLTPEQQYNVLEDIKTHAFEIRKQLEVHQQEEMSKEQIAIAKIDKYAKKYGVSANEMYAVVNCETGGTFDETIQARFVGTRGRERSFGLAQIHLTSHPSVSYEQATDSDFSLDFMAKHFANGDKDMWSCWRILKKQGII